jgi:hypothetical protein
MDKSFLLLFFKKEVLFFFEKKNQKTFICLVGWVQRREAADEGSGGWRCRGGEQ